MNIKTYARLKLLFENEKQSKNDVHFKYYKQDNQCSIIVERDNKTNHTANSKCEFVFYNISSIVKMYDEVKVKTKRNKFNTGFFKTDFKIKKDELLTKLNLINRHNMKLLEMLNLYYEKQELKSLDYTLEILKSSKLENYDEVNLINECFEKLTEATKRIKDGEEILF